MSENDGYRTDKMMDYSCFGSGSRKCQPPASPQAQKSCPISMELAFWKFTFQVFILRFYIPHFTILKCIVCSFHVFKTQISYTSFAVLNALFLTSPAPSKMWRWLQSRLLAKRSGSGNNTFGSSKGSERSTKLLIVLTGPWETWKKMALSEKVVGRKKKFLGSLRKNPGRIGDIMEFESVLGQ